MEKDRVDCDSWEDNSSPNQRDRAKEIVSAVERWSCWNLADKSQKEGTEREGERLREEIRPGMKRLGEGKKGGDFSGFGDLEPSRASSGGGAGTEGRVKAVYLSPPQKVILAPWPGSLTSQGF